MRGKSGSSGTDEAIWTLAEGQHGVVSRRQLLELGVGADSIDRRLKLKRLRQIHRGVYTIGHRLLTQEGRWMAAVLACGPRAVRSHRAAAALWGMRAGVWVEVTVPNGRCGRRGSSGEASPRSSRSRRCRRARSELEERFQDFLIRAGLPLPQTNVIVEGFEVDCVWPEQRLIVELDGHATHSAAHAFELDRARDRRLEAAGWRVIRITWRQLVEEPEQVEADLRRLLQPASRTV